MTSTERNLKALQSIYRVGLALSSERDTSRLLELVLDEAQLLSRADAGTIYLRTDQDTLRFVLLCTRSLGIRRVATSEAPIRLPELPLRDPESGEPNHHNIATYAALAGYSVNIADAYETKKFDFSGTKAFDARNKYRSKSMLTVPLVNQGGRVIGVLQLINALDEDSGEVIPFDEESSSFVEALASQAAVALDNRVLAQAQSDLLESFIHMIASSIDAKSPYTGGHCERVPELVELLTDEVCHAQEGPYADFTMTAEERYELRIAAWLHDCGKLITPTHVMDKATKLERIFDRIELVEERIKRAKRERELSWTRAQLDGVCDAATAEQQVALASERLDGHLAFLRQVNLGGERLNADDLARIHAIADERVEGEGGETPLLTEEEVYNLSVSRGTLTAEERITVNGHMADTVRMLEALPFPAGLQRVPEYACGHHEKMDGTGYPRGLFAGDMSVPARIVAIADVFEALTASDRPYKSGKTLSESLTIMGHMKRANHLDPQLFDIFVSSGAYRRYADKRLRPEQIDDVDEQALLSIEPNPLTLPDKATRDARWRQLLPEYQARFNLTGGRR